MSPVHSVGRPRFAALIFAALALACSHDKQAETGGYQQGQAEYAPAPDPNASYPATAAPPASYAGQAGNSAPNAYGQPQVAPPPAPNTAGPAPATPAAPAPPTPAASAQMLDPAAAAVVQPLLNQLAKTSAVAGSKPLGAALVGNFQTGQTLEAQIQLQPQKCYTVVASGMPPVAELNVQIVAATLIPNLAPVLATDNDSGATAVLGRKPNCYLWAFPLPTPAKIVLQVAAGSGLAAAQVYEK